MLHLVVAGLAPLLIAPPCEAGAIALSTTCQASVASFRPAVAAPRLSQQGSQGSASFEQRLARAGEQVRGGRHKQAIPLLKELLADDPRSAEAHMLLGVALRSLGAPEFLGEAQAELRQALALDPGLPWARFALARIYLDLGRVGRARTELEAGLRELPNQPLFLSFLGETYRRLGAPRRSLELSGRAVEVAPQLAIARFHQALAWRDLDEPENAVKALEAALRGEPVLPEMVRTLGELYLQTGRQGRATPILERAVKLDPSNMEGRLQLARAHLQQEQPDKALEQLAHVLPEGTPMLSSAHFQHVEADVHFLTAEAHVMNGRRDAARRAYQRAIEIQPDHDEARRRLADLTPSPQ